MYMATNWSSFPILLGKYSYLSKLWNVFVFNLKCICLEIEIVVKCIGVSRSGVDGWQLVELAASGWQPTPPSPSYPFTWILFSTRICRNVLSLYIYVCTFMFLHLPAGVMVCIQVPWKSLFWDNSSKNLVFCCCGAYCVYWCLYESQYVILMILSDCPTDTYIGHSSFCIVFLMEPRPLFIRVRDGSI